MSNEINNLYEFGGFRLNAQTNTLWRGDDLIPLSPKAFELLKLLVENRGEVVSKQVILDKVWTETFVEEGVLTQNIYTLRQTLGKDENGKQLIENLARRGYRLTVPIYCDTETRRRAETRLPPRSSADNQNRDSNLPASPRHRFSGSLAIVLIIGVVLLTVIGYRFFASLIPANPPPQITELKFKQLTDTGDVRYLTVSPDGNLVAFTRGFDIFLRNLQTNNEVKLNLENGTQAGCLQFSPDGNFIYFGNLYNRDEKGSVFRLSQRGGVPEIMAENIWSGFSLSPNGQELAFVRKFPSENRQGLIIKDLETGVEKTLKTLNLPEEFYWNNYPAWSSDGQKIAMVAVTPSEHFTRLLIFERENGKELELKPKNFRNVEQVVWNSGGNSLLAAANDGNNFQLWKISMSDAAAKRITNDLNSYLGISVSQDRKKLISRQRIYYSNIWVSKKGDLNNLKQVTAGTSRNDGLLGLRWLDEEKIVYTSNDEKIRDWNLWLLNTVDGTRQKLTSDTETQNDYPTVSADKKFIFFASDRNKESRIWRINPDGSNPTQVTFGEAETHHFPQVSPDGKWLYFIIKSGRSSTIGRKSLEENSVQELSGKTQFVPGNFLSLSPDGKFLAFQNISNQSPTHDANPKLQLAIMSTENPQHVIFTEIETLLQIVEWREDSKSFDYIVGNVKESGLLHQSSETDAKPTKILEMTPASIFNFAWSPSGENLAVSRGQLLRDVVLLTNFE